MVNSEKQSSKFLFHLDDFEFTNNESDSQAAIREKLQIENRELREKLKSVERKSQNL